MARTKNPSVSQDIVFGAIATALAAGVHTMAKLRESARAGLALVKDSKAVPDDVLDAKLAEGLAVCRKKLEDIKHPVALGIGQWLLAKGEELPLFEGAPAIEAGKRDTYKGFAATGLAALMATLPKPEAVAVAGESEAPEAQPKNGKRSK